ncbi:MotA/TolQ/ExbB proton channel family protein [Ketobacter alkanivorans]|nr:MotA/TolQ/ExbB proton channel family protein [Ketobacter alkanivorans]
MAGLAMIDPWQDINAFAEQGGPVIWLLLILSCLLWTLIIERLWYFWFGVSGNADALRVQWQQRIDRQSWCAHRVRDAFIAEVSIRLHTFLPLIKALVLLCPLLGLLGTVTGMVTVFDVVAVEGSSDAQAMARGVFRATLPTMAGLVVSISGLYMSAQLQRWADNRVARFADSLPIGSDDQAVEASHGCA